MRTFIFLSFGQKSALYVLAILLALSSCSNDAEIFEECFEEWGITIPYQDVSKSKTYKSMVALLDHLDKTLDHRHNLPSHSSYANFHTFTQFNSHLNNDEKAATFIEREDCISVLRSAYIAAIKDTKYNLELCPLFFEWLLASDVFIAKLDVTEKNQIMVLALEGVKVKYRGNYFMHFSIMTSIMLSSNYTPFVEDVYNPNPWIRDAAFRVLLGNHSMVEKEDGYYLVPSDPQPTDTNTDLFLEYAKQADLIIKYAKQFINENQ